MRSCLVALFCVLSLTARAEEEAPAETTGPAKQDEAFRGWVSSQLDGWAAQLTGWGRVSLDGEQDGRAAELCDRESGLPFWIVEAGGGKRWRLRFPFDRKADALSMTADDDCPSVPAGGPTWRDGNAAFRLPLQGRNFAYEEFAQTIGWRNGIPVLFSETAKTSKSELTDDWEHLSFKAKVRKSSLTPDQQGYEASGKMILAAPADANRETWPRTSADIVTSGAAGDTKFDVRAFDEEKSLVLELTIQDDNLLFADPKAEAKTLELVDHVELHWDSGDEESGLRASQLVIGFDAKKQGLVRWAKNAVGLLPGVEVQWPVVRLRFPRSESIARDEDVRLTLVYADVDVFGKSPVVVLSTSALRPGDATSFGWLRRLPDGVVIPPFTYAERLDEDEP